MISSYEVANYFLSKDPQRELFNKKLVEMNGRKFYEGNARLNKYLHIAQNLYIAKTGNKLFREDLYAYDNGAVEPSIQENYSILYSNSKTVNLGSEIEDFLDDVYTILKNATLDELIEISHEDPEWQAKHSFFNKLDQKMDSIARSSEYKQQYADMIKLMGRMGK